MEGKKELLKKLRNLYNTYSKSQSVLYEIENVEVEDNYERTVVLPPKPMRPLANKKLLKHYLTKGELVSGEDYYKKLPIGFGIAAIVQTGIYFAAKSGIKGTGSEADKTQIGFTNFTKYVLFALIGICLFFLVLNLLKAIKVLLNYGNYVASVNLGYEKKLDEYNNFLLERASYEKELNTYNELLEQQKEEEKLIRAKIKREKEEIANSIREEKYSPLIEKLEKENDGLIGKKYYSKLSQIIDLLESGRADNVKEAINLLEEIRFKERQLELEREKMEREEYAREKAARDEEERYEEEVWRREQQRKEDIRREEERRRDERIEEHRAALHQCSNCANIRGCKNYAKATNCPNYRHC